nr:MAG TPA: hypothetical protein [Caudoviricetes sp.]
MFHYQQLIDCPVRRLLPFRAYFFIFIKEVVWIVMQHYKAH